MEDVNGRPYAKLNELQPGDKVQVDDGFTCMHPWAVKTVHFNKHGPYVWCSGWHHHLDGQVDDGVHCTGVYKL